MPTFYDGKSVSLVPEGWVPPPAPMPKTAPQPLSDDDQQKIVDALAEDINFWSNVGIHQNEMVAKITKKVLESSADSNKDLCKGINSQIEIEIATRFDPLKTKIEEWIDQAGKDVEEALKKTGIDEDRVIEMIGKADKALMEQIDKLLDPIRKDVDKAKKLSLVDPGMVFDLETNLTRLENEHDADRKRIGTLETTVNELEEEAVKSFGRINALENLRSVDRGRIENLELEVGKLRKDLKNLTAWIDSQWRKPVEEKKDEGNKPVEDLETEKDEIEKRVKAFDNGVRADNGKPADTAKSEPVKKTVLSKVTTPKTDQKPAAIPPPIQLPQLDSKGKANKGGGSK